MLPRRASLLTLGLLVSIAAGSVSYGKVESREIAVYTRGIAEIQEMRTVEVEEGTNEVRLLGISNRAIPGTFTIETMMPNLTTKAISYSNVPLDIDQYWESQVGRDITVRTDDDKYSGILRLVNDRSLFLQTGKDPDELTRVSRNNIDEDELENIDRSLTTEPSILWTYNAPRSEKIRVTLTYLTEGFDWIGEHKAILYDTRAGVIAKAVVDNATGMSWDYDRLIFVGGDIHLAGDLRRVDRRNPKPGATAGDMATPFGPTRRWVLGSGSLLANHTTVLELLSADANQVEQTYVYDATIFNDRITSHVEFTLGKPLPAGDVSVYEVRGDDTMFIGQDRIDATPQGSPIDLTTGQVFDLTAERIRVREGRKDDGNTVQEFKIMLGNSSTENVTVKVLERMFGDWVITSAQVGDASVDYEKEDARTAAFHVDVPAGETRTLTYEIVYVR